MSLPEKNTLSAIFKNCVATYGDKIAFTMGDSCQLSYKKIGETADKFSYYLHSKGISTGDKVAIISENMPNWGISYFALTSMGAVVVPVLVDFSPNEMSAVIKHSEAKALIVSEKVFKKLENTLEFDGLIFIINNLSEFNTGETATAYWESHIAEATSWSPKEPSENDLACIIYTSEV
jgi:long-chain acyl-CoA synthetase